MFCPTAGEVTFGGGQPPGGTGGGGGVTGWFPCVGGVSEWDTVVFRAWHGDARAGVGKRL
ncbi:hypothetical protein Afil01_12220 [Actinorhabdospora filicis]|uniref:Uncharacterized protein n=1 Tax=Actinorhabdospora filicis TaxID=1785913 RepID=A0A9W6W983_9ACTN|nr:hypothetical protein Afil01_12220 [Actinorhabdospora filicis]